MDFATQVARPLAELVTRTEHVRHMAMEARYLDAWVSPNDAVAALNQLGWMHAELMPQTFVDAIPGLEGTYDEVIYMRWDPDAGRNNGIPLSGKLPVVSHDRVIVTSALPG
jgi:hypothetical protein